MMGGVKTNNWGETNISGLFAVGEAACTGVHGANRLASNSLLEVVVYSHRIIEKVGKGIETGPPVGEKCHYSLSQREAPGSVPSLSLSALQALLWDRVGIVRSGEGLDGAARILAAWEGRLPKPLDRPSYELANLVLAGRLITEGALLREESRGAHFRLDFPQPAQQWQRHIIFRIGG